MIFAEVNPETSVVIRTVSAESLPVCITLFGEGMWIETFAGSPPHQYAYAGLHYAPICEPVFVRDWIELDPMIDEVGYGIGQWMWHDGHAWESMLNDNWSTPGADENWRDAEFGR